MSLGPYPDFAWSYSRHKSLSTCARRYYWSTYGGWGGWDRHGADPETRRAYVLKKLTNLHLVAGGAIHRRAYELVMSAYSGRELPSVEELSARTRQRLNEVWRASGDVEAFREDPRQGPILRSFYYGERPGDEEIERVGRKVERCLSHLRGLELWERIADREVGVEFVDDPDVVPDPEVEVDGVPVYATPDLVVREPETGPPVLVDWKTGERSEDDDWQVAVYGLYVRHHLESDRTVARIHYLQDGDVRQLDLGPEELVSAEDRIRESLEEMRGFVEDPALNRARAREAFPLAANRWSCRRCNFFELCEEELRETGDLPWEG